MMRTTVLTSQGVRKQTGVEEDHQPQMRDNSTIEEGTYSTQPSLRHSNAYAQRCFLDKTNRNLSAFVAKDKSS